MGYRDRDQGRDVNYRPWQEERDQRAFPDYDDYGLHGEQRREYRGRESYEQQSRGGEAGRSGMWPQRGVPRDIHERYRNNADEDRRGYQNLSSRSEFQSADRSRPDYGRYGRANDRDYEEARFDANRYANDDYSRTDYGGYRERDSDYGSPFSRREDYNSRYDQGAEYRSDRNYGGYAGNYGSRSWSTRADHTSGFDQGRLAESEYGRSQVQRRVAQGPRGYKRSDERIREDVCDRLGHDWDVDATEVEVTVTNGEVTLAGTINDRVQKFRVEHLADSVSGVTEVHNQLRVKRELPVHSQGSTQSSTQQTGKPTTNQNRSS